MEKIKTSLYVPVDLYKKLAEVAEKERRSKHAMILVLIEEGLKNK